MWAVAAARVNPGIAFRQARYVLLSELFACCDVSEFKWMQSSSLTFDVGSPLTEPPQNSGLGEKFVEMTKSCSLPDVQGDQGDQEDQEDPVKARRRSRTWWMHNATLATCKRLTSLIKYSEPMHCQDSPSCPSSSIH